MTHAMVVGVTDFEQIFAGLEAKQVRYLVVGGVAVVLHGHPRFTADLDLVLLLDDANTRAALGALSGLGYRPRLPVRLEEFADPAARKRWSEEKNLVAFTLWSANFPATEVDLFVNDPFPFQEAFERASNLVLSGGVHVRVASIADLIELKRAAGRPKDLEDIAALQAIGRMRGGS